MLHQGDFVKYFQKYKSSLTTPLLSTVQPSNVIMLGMGESKLVHKSWPVFYTFWSEHRAVPKNVSGLHILQGGQQPKQYLQ